MPEAGEYNGVIPSVLGELHDVARTPPADGDTLVWNATAGEWEPGAAQSGTSVLLGSYNEWHSGPNIDLPSDGARHDESLILGSPPEWMDGAGNITEPGLYALGFAAITLHVNPTTPGLYLQIAGAFTADWAIPLDSLTPAGGSGANMSVSDVMALGSGDVPYPTGTGLYTPTDATAVMRVRFFITRLAWTP